MSVYYPLSAMACSANRFCWRLIYSPEQHIQFVLEHKDWAVLFYTFFLD
ncbi:MAG TPA: hypothetical protein VGQ53_18805 [Chitinophagaceae bacterium]|nr:hypothetical protein [Chitinophagaceae bacterium]